MVPFILKLSSEQEYKARTVAMIKIIFFTVMPFFEFQAKITIIQEVAKGDNNF